MQAFHIAASKLVHLEKRIHEYRLVDPIFPCSVYLRNITLYLHFRKILYDTDCASLRLLLINDTCHVTTVKELVARLFPNLCIVPFGNTNSLCSCHHPPYFLVGVQLHSAVKFCYIHIVF